LKLGKKRRESSKRNYYIISPRVIIKAIIIITHIKTRSQTNHTQMDVQPTPFNRDFFRDSFKRSVALEIIIDLPFGFFAINNIISLSLSLYI